MITIEELIDILKKRGVYNRRTMACYSRGRSSFVLCSINNKKPFADLYVITRKCQSAKWEYVRTIHNMLKRGRIHYVVLLRICVFNNCNGFKTIVDGEDTILHIGKDYQNKQKITQILDDYSLWQEE
jgi:hypothetical protein